MPSQVIEYAGFGSLLVAAVVALWYRQPRKLPPHPETDDDLRPSSDRIRQDVALDRMRVRLRAKGGTFPLLRRVVLRGPRSGEGATTAASPSCYRRKARDLARRSLYSRTSLRMPSVGS